MSRIKSALEIAMEKAQSLGEPTPEERLAFTFVPEGERLAIVYVREEGELTEALERSDPEARPYLVRGMSKVLMHNIRLPRSDVDRQSTERAFHGMRAIKTDKKATEEIISRIQHICATFLQYREQGLEQVYRETKDHFEQRVREALRMRSGLPASPNIDVESTPEFQQEWMRVVAQFDAQYEVPLEEQKALLAGIP